MDKQSIKDYILKYKENYSFEQIKMQLKNGGATEEEINSVYQEVKPKKTMAGLGLFLILFGLIIPVIGYIMIIIGTILGFKTYKNNPNSNFGIVTGVIGIISLLIGIIVQIILISLIIFSFVDFENLYPNQITLDNNLFADTSGSIAYSKDSSGDNANLVRVIFQYNGAQMATISGVSNISQINLTDGGICDSIRIENLDTGDISTTSENEVNFLNIQKGIMDFDCRGEELTQGNSVEGDISIDVKYSNTNTTKTSEGEIKLEIVTG